MKNILTPIFILLFLQAEAQSVSALAISKKADSLFEIGEYNKAIPYFIKGNRFQEVARSYEAIGNNGEAQHYYEKAIFENNNNPKIEFQYGKLLFKISNYKQADSIFQNL